jgi:hypothetical protein
MIMHRNRLLLKSALSVLLAFPALTVMAGVAQAQAEVLRFEFVQPLPTETSLPECLDDTVGSQVGTEATTLQVVDTGKTSHVTGTATLTYTVTFDDGRYVTGSSVEHFRFNANAPLTVSTVVITESRTIFSADGEPVGKVKIHALSHVTLQDANENGSPDPGEIRVEVDRFFFTCG